MTVEADLVDDCDVTQTLQHVAAVFLPTSRLGRVNGRACPFGGERYGGRSVWVTPTATARRILPPQRPRRPRHPRGAALHHPTGHKRTMRRAAAHLFGEVCDATRNKPCPRFCRSVPAVNHRAVAAGLSRANRGEPYAVLGSTRPRRGLDVYCAERGTHRRTCLSLSARAVSLAGRMPAALRLHLPLYDVAPVGHPGLPVRRADDRFMALRRDARKLLRVPLPAQRGPWRELECMARHRP